MHSETLNGFLSEKLQKQDFNGIKGTNLAFHIPVEEELLNSIIQTIISTSEKMEDIHTLHFSEMDENKFLIYIDHKRLNKTIRCEIQELDYNSRSEPILQIKFLEGFQLFEKFALTSVISIKKGLNWFKSKWHDETSPREQAETAFKISSSKLTLNISQLLKQQNLDYLIPLITWNDISTNEDKLVIDFNIKV
jgi:hypothetical protein